MNPFKIKSKHDLYEWLDLVLRNWKTIAFVWASSFGLAGYIAITPTLPPPPEEVPKIVRVENVIERVKVVHTGSCDKKLEEHEEGEFH